MPVVLKVLLISMSAILFAFTWTLVSRGRLALKYALIWLATSFVLILVAAIPHITSWSSGLLGFQLSSNFIFSVIIAFLVLICISYSISITSLDRKINSLTQHIGIIEESASFAENDENKLKILVIIPAFNESENICRTVSDLKLHAPFVDYVVINDGSTDETARICKENSLNHINLPINLGIGCAVQTGYKYAKKHGYDIAIQFDGDGQHNASCISQLVKQVENGHDLVVGSRFIEKEGFQSSVMRRVGISWLCFVTRVFFGKKITDPTSGFRACGKRLIDHFALSYPTDYPEPETVAVAFLNKYNVIEIPVVMNERIGGVSSIKRLKSVYYMIKVTLAIINVRMQKKVVNKQ